MNTGKFNDKLFNRRLDVGYHVEAHFAIKSTNNTTTAEVYKMENLQKINLASLPSSYLKLGIAVLFILPLSNSERINSDIKRINYSP